MIIKRIKSILRNPSFLWKGEWSQEKQDQARIAYAKKNPWVLGYSFGHKELMERDRSFNETII